MDNDTLNLPIRFRFSGQEDVYHKVNSYELLPQTLKERGYSRAYIICSKTLNTKTDVIRMYEESLGAACLGVTHEVGEHAPISNIIAAANAIREAKADVLIAVGGGSVIDFTRFVQLCMTENITSKEDLQNIAAGFDAAFNVNYSSTKIPSIRFIAIPTTMSTAEWTFGGTPMVEETKQKIMLIFKWGGPEVIMYDPQILTHTPTSLLLKTAVRGLDHAINTRIARFPHPLADPIVDKAIQLFMEYLPKLHANPKDLEALHQLTLATAMSGMCQVQTFHGFSHWMVHIVGPFASVGHSEAACVCMLAQARYFEGYADERLAGAKKLMGKEGENFSDLIVTFLEQIGMPTSFSELGIDSAKLDEMAPMAMKHPLLKTFNIRPIDTKEKARAVMALAE